MEKYNDSKKFTEAKSPENNDGFYPGRRNILAAMSAMSAIWLVGCGSSHHHDDGDDNSGTSPGTATLKREISFDDSWQFIRDDISGAEALAFDDKGWRTLDLPHDWRVEDLPYATSTDSSATNDPSAFAFIGSGAGATVQPRAIGPFDVDADPVPDLDTSYPGVGAIIIQGGSSQGYTVGHIGWYRKHFTVEKNGTNTTQSQRVEIRLDGVHRNYTAWINGQLLGFQSNGYTPSIYDVTPYLRPDGNNVLAVRVDSTGKSSRWLAGSGIYRHTWITVTNPVHIPYSGIFVTTPTAVKGASIAKVAVTVSNSGTIGNGISVRVTVLDQAGKSVSVVTSSAQQLAPLADGIFSIELPVPGALLWSPEEPNLYQVQCEALVNNQVVDSAVATFGIRSLTMDGTNGMRLNGRRYVARGACIHHDHGPLGAMSLDRSEIRRIEILKAAGFNAIRTSHNPHSPALLDACDRLGMLVMDEFSDVWDAPKQPDDFSKYFPDEWQKDLTAFIKRDRNHPSVVMWSLGNEIAGDANKYGPRLAALVRGLDSTRSILTGGSANVGAIAESAWQYNDIGDVHYEVDLTKYHASHPDKAICRSEDHGPKVFELSSFDEANAWMVGSFVWTGWDYIGETGVGAPVIASITSTPEEIDFKGLDPALGKVQFPWYVAFTGDIDLIGQRKAQNFYRNVVYGNSQLEMMVQRPTPVGTQQFSSHWSYYDELPSWTWDVQPGKLMSVRILTRADSVTLQLNGTTLETKSMAAEDKYVAAFQVPYTAGDLTAIVHRNGAEIARKTLSTVGAPAKLRLSSDVKSLTTSRNDLAHVLVEVVDSQGRVVPDAVINVTMTSTGAGKIIGVANGNPHNPDSFIRGDRWTWHGQALAVLRPGKSVGTITMTATSPTLSSATLSLDVTPVTGNA